MADCSGGVFAARSTMRKTGALFFPHETCRLGSGGAGHGTPDDRMEAACCHVRKTLHASELMLRAQNMSLRAHKWLISACPSLRSKNTAQTNINKQLLLFKNKDGPPSSLWVGPTPAYDACLDMVQPPPFGFPLRTRRRA